jgi:hypothetical protein
MEMPSIQRWSPHATSRGTVVQSHTVSASDGMNISTVNSAIVTIRGRVIYYIFLVDAAGGRAHVSIRANFAEGDVSMHHAPASGLLSARNAFFTASRALPETCNSDSWSWTHTIEPVSVPLESLYVLQDNRRIE